MNPLLATSEYDSALGREGRDGNARKMKKILHVSGAKLVNPFMIVPEYEGETPAGSISKNIDKKRKRERRSNERPSDNSEYDSALGGEGRDGSGRKMKKKMRVPGSKSVNPFMVVPEYEKETPAGSISNKSDTKRSRGRLGNGRKSEDRGVKHPENLSEKERLVSAEQNGNSKDLSKSSDGKFQSRCLNTFSKNKILEGEPRKVQKYKRNDRSERMKNKFGPSKQNGMKASQGFADFAQKKKWNKRPESNASRYIVKNAKKHMPKSRNEQEGPITWGLPSTAWGASESLSLDGIGGFNWNATPQDFAKIVSCSNGVVEEESEESDEEVVVKGKKLTPAERRAKILEEEKNMKKKEKELMEAEDNPQSPDHFERLLIGSPNSAELWIKYMGYHAVNADIEKARAVAQRAIKRIDPQLTSAKLDVWIAFLNLDFTFSPPDVFRETFSEATRRNDDYAINSRVLNLYAEAKNVSETDQLANTMVRKYKEKLENWLQCQNALMMVGLPDKARYMLQKALTLLNKKDHVTLISRFALLENKYGFSEQSDALFENLLTSFPQRVDLLNVYVDMLVKSNRTDLARSVLERAANNQLPVRKMKTIYTKWISFEEAHGTPSDVSRVEEAAQQYVSRVLKPHASSVDDDRASRNLEEARSLQQEYQAGAGSSDAEEDFGSEESDGSG